MQEPILIVEDDHLQRKMLGTLLKRKFDFNCAEAENGRDALNILKGDHASSIKLIILDLEMPVMDGMETLRILRQKYNAIPVIMLTGNKDTSKAVEAMKLGAIDFVNKPYDAERMVTTVRNALKISTLTKEVSRLKQKQSGAMQFDQLIGHDGGLLPIISTARKAALSDIPILITGETGTGKEVFSRAIHGESAFNQGPFIAVNCGAIPAQLVESTLFGHEKGSFTGATDKTLGKFREAEGGTLFLDEVGELPMDAQVKLLRVLQQSEVEPVGAGQAVPVRVRVISATNRDLEQAVKDGTFREDLLFRLNVIHLELPPLRERREDIPALARHFIDQYCIENNIMPKTLSHQTIKNLCRAEWSGNVRELENTIKRAIVMSDGHDVHIGSDDAKPNTKSRTIDHERETPYIDIMRKDGTFKTVDEIEREAMTLALNHFEQNITQSAKALGMAKSTFYKKLK